MSYAIEAEGIVKRFGKTIALAGVDLAARPGTVLGVLGPNGAGKTTAVRVLATLTTPDAGRATVGGFDVVKHPQQVRDLIGLTGQYASVDEDLTGTENLVLLSKLLGLSRAAAKQRAAELLEEFSLTDAAGRSVNTYSGGMRRRLDLAASLVGRPQILYLDEPTTGLDPRSRNDVWAMIRNLVADGMTVLLTTQYLDEADELANHIAVIDTGRVIAEGTADELKAKVGGQTLEVRPTDISKLDMLQTIVADVTGTVPTVDVRRALVAAPADDPAVLPTVVRRLDEAHILAAELILRRPSLDEVFLALTGHKAESQDDTAAIDDQKGNRA